MWRIVVSGCSACVLLILSFGCSRTTTGPPSELPIAKDSVVVLSQVENIPETIHAVVKRNVLMKDYFFFIDSLADTTFHSSSVLNEYLLVNANPWIIDSLRSLDYYTQKKKGVFIYDQSMQIILHKGDTLIIPDSTSMKAITNKLKSNRIDLNIPEYRLRVIQDQDTLLSCLVRIGRNAEGYLEFYQRDVDLRTPIGEGEIVTVRKKPKYIDLQSGEEYLETNRDDGRRTKMPIIPSLEPSINGKFVGTLIHATTNPKSLGKAYSHGCVGTSEPDIWSIYYLCPPGTKVNFHYDLEIKNQHGKTLELKDVYHLSAK